MTFNPVSVVKVLFLDMGTVLPGVCAADWAAHALTHSHTCQPTGDATGEKDQILIPRRGKGKQGEFQRVGGLRQQELAPRQGPQAPMRLPPKSLAEKAHKVPNQRKVLGRGQKGVERTQQ